MKVGLRVPDVGWPSGPAGLGSEVAGVVRTADEPGFDSIGLEPTLNRQTQQTPPDAPEAWIERRPRWDRFNRIRTVLWAAGWSLPCLGALSDPRG